MSIYLAMGLIYEGNLLRCVRARAHVRALMTQKSCAVGMRNAKLGNHLKLKSRNLSSGLFQTKIVLLRARYKNEYIKDR